MTTTPRRLAAELLAAEQHDKQRASELLHDELQQLVIAARMRLDMLAGRVSDEPTAEALKQTVSLMDDIVSQSRDLTGALAPSVLEEDGFIAAAHWLAERMAMSSGFKVNLDIHDAAEPQDAVLHALLYAAMQKALANVRQHAQVMEATVTPRELDDGQLHLSISDKGAGFEPSKLQKPNGNGGAMTGLAGLHTRLEAVGASMQVTSQHGGGTVVDVFMPTSIDEG